LGEKIYLRGLPECKTAPQTSTIMKQGVSLKSLYNTCTYSESINF